VAALDEKGELVYRRRDGHVARLGGGRVRPAAEVVVVRLVGSEVDAGLSGTLGDDGLEQDTRVADVVLVVDSEAGLIRRELGVVRPEGSAKEELNNTGCTHQITG
jgi:hypothetical protein